MENKEKEFKILINEDNKEKQRDIEESIKEIDDVRLEILDYTKKNKRLREFSQEMFIFARDMIEKYPDCREYAACQLIIGTSPQKKIIIGDTPEKSVYSLESSRPWSDFPQNKIDLPGNDSVKEFFNRMKEKYILAGEEEKQAA